MNLTNREMDLYLSTLQPVMKCSGRLAYFIARNYRRLIDASKEYMDRRDQLLKQYGKPTETGQIELRFDDPNFELFENELKEIIDIEHTVEICKCKYSDIDGQLTAEQIVALDWMLEEDSDAA